MIRVAAYASPDEFLSENRELLEQREAENSTLLASALRGQSSPALCWRCTHWVARNGQHGTELLADFTPPQPLLLAAIGPKASMAAAQLARALRAGGWQVPEVIGRDAVASSYAECWRGLTGEGWHVQRRLRIYELRARTRPAHGRGKLRPATTEDLPLVTLWAKAFKEEALGERRAWDACGYARQRLAAGEIAIWDDGGPVAMAGHGRPTPHGIAVNLVYTPPELRGRGYASTCVATLSEQLLEQGREFCTLSADLANATANRIYRRIGYVPVSDFDHIVFGA